MLPRSILFSILLGLAGLTSCDNASTSPSGGGERKKAFAGTYRLEADRMIFHSAPNLSESCNGSDLQRREDPGRTDTSTVLIAANRMKILSDPDAFQGEGGGEALIQYYSENIQVSGRSGIQGIWKETESGYSILSGVPSQASREFLDRYTSRIQERSRFFVNHFEMTPDTVWTWSEGDFAGFFLAEWKGEISSSWEDSSAAEQFDVQVRAVDSRMVELLGLKNGEKVTVTFEGPHRVRTYSSDQPGRESYKSSDFQCPYDGDWNWYGRFLEMNRK